MRLNKEPIIEYINSNIVMLKWMIANGYEDERSLGRRIKAMEAWLADPKLLQPDADAEYAAVIEIDQPTCTNPSWPARTTPTTSRRCRTWPAPRSTKCSSAAA